MLAQHASLLLTIDALPPAASWRRSKEERAAGFVFHPYPVTPYHADYLHHLDRVEAAKDAVG